jgi:hypothetical protein
MARKPAVAETLSAFLAKLADALPQILTGLFLRRLGPQGGAHQFLAGSAR